MKYTRKQIKEAIQHWTKVLESMEDETIINNPIRWLSPRMNEIYYAVADMFEKNKYADQGIELFTAENMKNEFKIYIDEDAKNLSDDEIYEYVMEIQDFINKNFNEDVCTCLHYKHEGEPYYEGDLEENAITSMDVYARRK